MKGGICGKTNIAMTTIIIIAIACRSPKREKDKFGVKDRRCLPLLARQNVRNPPPTDQATDHRPPQTKRSLLNFPPNPPDSNSDFHLPHATLSGLHPSLTKSTRWYLLTAPHKISSSHVLPLDLSSACGRCIGTSGGNDSTGIAESNRT